MAQRVTPAIPSAAQAQSAVNGLPAIVQHWMLRILIDLKGEQYLIGRHGFKDEDVATQLGFRELLTEAQFDDPDIGAVRKHLRSMAKALKQEAIAVPDVLAANVSRIADLAKRRSCSGRTTHTLTNNWTYCAPICAKPWRQDRGGECVYLRPARHGKNTTGPPAGPRHGLRTV